MSYYRVCPDCGCNLDPGERCDCKKEQEFKPDIRLYGNVQQVPVVTQDVLIIGYDRSKTDMTCMTIARKNGDRIIILKEFLGEEAVKEYENLTMGPCVQYDPQMAEFLKKNFNVPCEPRKQQTTFK